MFQQQKTSTAPVNAYRTQKLGLNDHRQANFIKNRTEEPMDYTTQTSVAHTVLEMATVGRQGRDEMKAKMQTKQFVMGMEAPQSETSSSLVGRTAVHANSHSVSATSDTRKTSNIVLGSEAYNPKMPTEAQASY